MDEQQQTVALASSAAIGAATGMAALATMAYVLWSRKPSKEARSLTEASSSSDTTTSTAGMPSLSRVSSLSLEECDDCLTKIYVYFGSQTGTAQAFARQLEREGKDHGFSIRVLDLLDTTVQDLVREDRINRKTGTATAIFLTSTYGEGEAPDNAASFVKELEELRQAGEPAALPGLDFGVFGLGNKQYDHFNAMAKLMDNALGTLGGKRIVELGLGDDDSDLEGDFESWKDNLLWPTLKQIYGDDSSNVLSTDGSQSTPESQCIVEYYDNYTFQHKILEASTQDVQCGPYRPMLAAVDCPVTVVRELRTAEDVGSTVHVEIDISDHPQLQYQAADNLGVFPQNETSTVASLAQSLDFDLDQVFSLRAAAAKQEGTGAFLPKPITVRDCLTNYCDLTSAPRRSDLKVLASYASEATDKEQLLHLASQDGKSDYQRTILDQYAGLADVLRMFPSISMSLDHFLTICPVMQARYYTIASSSSAHPTSIHLTVAVNTAMRSDGSTFHGLCSYHIARSVPGVSTLRVCVRPSTFRLPEDVRKPILMIGPGTGIAPMRAMLQERAYQRTVLQQRVGPNVLYFGCKRATQDYLYQDEIRAYQESGDLDELYVAFSRAQAGKKCYVQHLLTENAANTYRLLESDGASVYVCGACQMGSDVSDTLKTILMEHGQMDSDAATRYLANMAQGGRYVQELWA